jgi:serine/threonine-protein kinase
MTTASGTTIGSVRIEETLRSGGSSALLLGRQPALERLVAVRRFPGELIEDSAALDRFRREARLGGRIHHPNVVAVHDCFAYRGDHYLILEYVDGPDLREVIARAAPAPAPVAVCLGAELARGLRELHARGIVHGNLAPERVLFSRWGEPKIRGLGLARELGEESPPAVHPGPYAAPEWAEGEGGDARADIYSVGALLHEILTGEPPDSGRTRPSGVPGPLARLVSRCLDPIPERRTRSAGALLRELESMADHPEPQRCRGVIVDWLYAEGILRPAQSPRVEDRPALPEEEPTHSRFSTLAWGLSGAAVAAATLFAVLEVLPIRERAPTAMPTDPEPVPPVAAGPVTPARIRFVVHPWAQVGVEGKPPFLTPRARPVEVQPGEHRVVFRHPDLGTVKQKIRVKAGEERVIRHVLSGERPS